VTFQVKHILFATDFSDCARQAQDYAIFLAGDWKAGLTILHVLEFQPGMDPDQPVNRMYLDQVRAESDRQLNALVSIATQRGMVVMARQVTGFPSQQIVQEAEQDKANLVVVGTHGRTGLAHILLGSTAERVVASAPCPVLTVRPCLDQAAPASSKAAVPRLRTILVPVDFSDCSRQALEYAAHTAGHFGASLTLLHVVEPVSYGLDFTLASSQQGPEMRAQLEARLAELAATLSAQWLTTDAVIRGGTPASSILDLARQRSYDLIIMGTHGRRGLSHLACGSVAEAVLRHASCPVLTVKGSPSTTTQVT
jgi:nucleotide-binding universal stress UspA family protein